MNIRTLLASLLIVAAPMASAHIVFEQKQAPAGSYYKGTLLVGHGCNGSATRAVTVTIPDGVQGVHPQPKPGWQLEINGRSSPSPIPRTARPSTRTCARSAGLATRWPTNTSTNSAC
jgi:uncharacterized protein YcnI